MSFKKIKENCYYYHSSVNIGYIQEGENGLLIDAGIDRSAVKKVLRELESRELPLTHLFITHAHADHYGGASYIQDSYSVHTMAPPFEEAILRNPMLEPLYLFGGNDPVEELDNKFLRGEAIHIDEVIEEGKVSIGSMEAEVFVLPGHSYQQAALMINGILYAGDSYFSNETLTKHKIPFITDVAKTLNSLNRLLSMDYEGAVPGHGVFESDPTETINQNITYHTSLMDWLEDYLSNYSEGVSHEQVVSDMCQAYNVQASGLGHWLLYRTAVTAYLLGLKKDQHVYDKIADFRWTFFSSSKN
ncbi:MBL fold metallo-hydrolase [Halobacillus yeomjeoni]|uniref:MBL fold metallo-hydrolase n=1 Tax=Halobacillus yeomjeoni TaxID=311194 RepID=A0A931HSJ3_9BACI|nr:MBL fold metallo-hydrolase [Halobacillus yeomjeoni]MBH0228817.1 MBL fold metallo-hydrolase [Halobacillus yeomjeoni]